MPRSREGQIPCPSRRVYANMGRLWEVLRHKASGPFGAEPEDEKKSRINAGVAGGASGQSQLPAVRAVPGIFQVVVIGVKSGKENQFCGHSP